MKQKKSFLEDGGGFDRIADGTVNLLKRFHKSRFAQIAGLVLIFLFVVNFLFGNTVLAFDFTLQDNGLRRSLQNELNIPQTAGMSDAQMEEINLILLRLMKLGYFPDDLFDDYVMKFGEKPFNPQEMQLLQECATLCFRLDEAAWDFWMSDKLSLCFGLMLGIWLSSGKGRKVRYQLLAILAGIVIGIVPVVLFSVYMAQDAASTVRGICDLLFSSNVWPLNPETGILAQICTPDVFAGIWKNVLRGLWRRFSSIRKEFALMCLFVVGAGLISKIIDLIKYKKNKTEEST